VLDSKAAILTSARTSYLLTPHGGGDLVGVLGGSLTLATTSGQQPRTPKEEDFIMKELQLNSLFSHLDESQAKEVVKVMERLSPTQGSTLYRAGDQADCFYVVETGLYQALKQAPGETEEHIVQQYSQEHPESSGSFGELGLIYNIPRLVTVRVQKAGILWALKREVWGELAFKFRHCAHELCGTSQAGIAPSPETLDSRPSNKGLHNLSLSGQQKEAVLKAIGCNHVFSCLPLDQQQRVVEIGEPFDVDPGQVVYLQGQVGARFFVVVSGIFEVLVWQSDSEAEPRRGSGMPKVVNEYAAQDSAVLPSFGEMSLIHALPRACTVRAKVPARVWSLHRDELETALARQRWKKATNVIIAANRFKRQGLSRRLRRQDKDYVEGLPDSPKGLPRNNSRRSLLLSPSPLLDSISEKGSPQSTERLLVEEAGMSSSRGSSPRSPPVPAYSSPPPTNLGIQYSPPRVDDEHIKKGASPAATPATRSRSGSEILSSPSRSNSATEVGSTAIHQRSPKSSAKKLWNKAGTVLVAVQAAAAFREAGERAARRREEQIEDQLFSLDGCTVDDLPLGGSPPGGQAPCEADRQPGSEYVCVGGGLPGIDAAATRRASVPRLEMGTLSAEPSLTKELQSTAQRRWRRAGLMVTAARAFQEAGQRRAVRRNSTDGLNEAIPMGEVPIAAAPCSWFAWCSSASSQRL